MADGEATDTTTGTTETTQPQADAAAAPPAETTAEGGDETTVLGDGASEPQADADADTTTDADAEPASLAPEKYELTAPEGMTLDDEAVQLADPVFRELNLTNEQAQKLMPIAGEFAQRAGAAAIAKHQRDHAQTVTSMRREWLENAKGDAEIGGANWDGTVSLAAKGLDALGFTKGHPFRALLDETGFGNHPEMIRAMRRVGERVGEDTFERGGSGDAKPKSDRELFYPGYTKQQ